MKRLVLLRKQRRCPDYPEQDECEHRASIELMEIEHESSPSLSFSAYSFGVVAVTFAAPKNHNRKS
jgi:hypothetical protein